MSAQPDHETKNEQILDKEEEEQIDDVEEEEIMDDEEEMEIPAPEDGSPEHFVIQGKPVISSPPQMVSDHGLSLFSVIIKKMKIIIRSFIINKCNGLNGSNHPF